MPTPTQPRGQINNGDGLNSPIKLAIGIGGGAVVLLLVAVITSSFLSSAGNKNVARQETSPGAGSPAEPAARSALSNAADFVSGLVTGKPRVYETPQAVFDAYWRAREKDDLKTLLGTLAPHRREEMVASSLRLLATLRPADPDLTEGLEKYGVDFKTISGSTSESRLREIAAGIKNPAAFLEAANRRLVEAGQQRWKDMAEAAKQARSQRPPGSTDRQPRPTPRPRRQLTAEERRPQAEEMRRQMNELPRLEDLQIDGNSAKGTVVKGGDLFRMSSEITFVKVGESWFVDQVQM